MPFTASSAPQSQLLSCLARWCSRAVTRLLALFWQVMRIPGGTDMKSAYSMRRVIVSYAVAMLISGANYAEESIPVDPMTGEALAQPIP